MEEIMNTCVEQEEREHLKDIKCEIQTQIEMAEQALNNKKIDIMDQKAYLWENIYELDPEEIAASRSGIMLEYASYDIREDRLRLLRKQLENPYFGRLDFVFEGDDFAEEMYIGLGGLQSKDGFDALIYDWRAPVSSMYYDFDTGKAFYKAPMGEIYGDIKRKRQLKIRNGELEYAFEANFNVYDEILQRELSQNGSTKMRNIVATIQKEQNSIVRDEKSNVLVVQGVAGSGKTSIALHRIAFLLYKNRQSLKSSDVLIVSPNTIFSDYISNVLPELGEQNISNVSFDEIAKNELKGICKFESKKDFMEFVIGCNDEESRLQIIQYKSGIDFLEELKTFVNDLETNLIQFKRVLFRGASVDVETIQKWFYQKLANYPIFVRLNKIADLIADRYESDNDIDVLSSARADIRSDLYNMAFSSNIMDLYNRFITKIKSKHSFIDNDFFVGTKCVRYEDAFAIVLMKFLLFGCDNINFKRIKHVVLDEMQDYSMIQFEIIKTMFNCNMTILGDVNQVVDKENATIVENLEQIFESKATLIRMLKSYRSTFEISEFCRKLCHLSEAESFQRHGEAPVVEQCFDYKDMVNAVQRKIDSFTLGDTTTIAVICKSGCSAEKVYNSLDDEHKGKVYLMNDEKANFHPGIIVTNSYLVKGLEFDYVIIPEVTKEEYKTERDRQVLYIAGTRALHELHILYHGERSVFVEDALN